MSPVPLWKAQQVPGWQSCWLSQMVPFSPLALELLHWPHTQSCSPQHSTSLEQGCQGKQGREIALSTQGTHSPPSTAPRAQQSVNTRNTLNTLNTHPFPLLGQNCCIPQLEHPWSYCQREASPAEQQHPPRDTAWDAGHLSISGTCARAAHPAREGFPPCT